MPHITQTHIHSYQYQYTVIQQANKINGCSQHMLLYFCFLFMSELPLVGQMDDQSIQLCYCQHSIIIIINIRYQRHHYFTPQNYFSPQNTRCFTIRKETFWLRKKVCFHTGTSQLSPEGQNWQTFLYLWGHFFPHQEKKNMPAHTHTPTPTHTSTHKRISQLDFRSEPELHEN